MYTNSFQGDTDDLGHAGGRKWERCPPASPVSGEDYSQPIDTCCRLEALLPGSNFSDMQVNLFQEEIGYG